MKKSFLCALILVLSSFFFISINKVEAYEYSLDFDLSLINDKFFLFKEKVEQYIKEKNDLYLNDFLIVYNINSRRYEVLFIKKGDDNFYKYTWFRNASQGRIDFNSKIASQQFLNDKGIFTIRNDNIDFITFFDYYNILYSTFPLIYNSTACSGGHKYSVNYNGWTKEYSGCDESFKPFYDIKLEYDKFVGDSTLKHKEEISNISNFYTICIEKIKYLGEQIVSNYIYLSMVVVLILIFVIELIRRWLM